MLRQFRQRRRLKEQADGIYVTLVAQARSPVFYAEAMVPDSLDGRFELVVLHVYAFTRAMQGRPEPAGELSRLVVEAMFDDMDRTLREIGVGDISVGRKVKQMAAAFYGRAAAYDAALDGEGRALEQALVRNVYAGVAPPGDEPRRLAAYLRGTIASLVAGGETAVAERRVVFPTL
jgi:cytochrome b pre-mRNA-processing protein 3